MLRCSSARVLVSGVLGLALLAACGPTEEGVVCGGINQPTTLTLGNLTPALGDTVANASIVHSFSVLDDVQFGDIVLQYPDAHSAGAPDPALTFSYKVSEYTTDYTATAVAWENAPAHVEIDTPLIYQTPDGCAYRLPSPLFSYDLTSPGGATTPGDATSSGDTTATGATSTK